MKIKLTKKQQEFLKRGSAVKISEDVTYYYLPYWYKKTKGNDILDELGLDCLPKELINKVKELNYEK